MEERVLTQDYLSEFKDYLYCEEKSKATIQKYFHDVQVFIKFSDGQKITKDIAVAYKQHLIDQGYALRSINSMLASINKFFEFLNWSDCKVKSVKCQRAVFCEENRMLSKAEYMRLLDASKEKKRLNLIMQTICGTGIRVSELQYFTVDKIRQGQISVNCKNKIRTILVPGKLRKKLLDYAKKKKIHKGCIFVTKNGKPMDRSNIWSEMKKICKTAHVNPHKVFPHNLRKLFARTFYNIEKDVVKLADVLGHGSIETTRIYIMTTSNEHRRKIERLGLVT